jgi:DNA-binding CsgD family transcriptional regulator
MSDTQIANNPLGELTAKQREVLDLLIQHKTSKEISRILGISPHTVDQRIMLSRAKLNVATRGEVAQEYRRLVGIYERSVYEDSHVASPADQGQIDGQDDVEVRAPGPIGTGTLHPAGMPSQAYYHVLPEMFDGPHGTLFRLGYIVVITVFLIVAVMGGLAMFSQLYSLVDVR